MITTKNKLFGIILFLITLASINTGFALTPEEILQMDKDAYAAEIAVPTENARRAAKMATTILHNKMIAPADKRDAIRGHIDTAQDQADSIDNISKKPDYANVPKATKDEARDRIKVFVDKAKDCLFKARARELEIPQKAAARALRRQQNVAAKKAAQKQAIDMAALQAAIAAAEQQAERQRLALEQRDREQREQEEQARQAELNRQAAERQRLAQEQQEWERHDREQREREEQDRRDREAAQQRRDQEARQAQERRDREQREEQDRRAREAAQQQAAQQQPAAAAAAAAAFAGNAPQPALGANLPALRQQMADAANEIMAAVEALDVAQAYDPASEPAIQIRLAAAQDAFDRLGDAVTAAERAFDEAQRQQAAAAQVGQKVALPQQPAGGLEAMRNKLRIDQAALFDLPGPQRVPAMAALRVLREQIAAAEAALAAAGPQEEMCAMSIGDDCDGRQPLRQLPCGHKPMCDSCLKATIDQKIGEGKLLETECPTCRAENQRLTLIPRAIFQALGGHYARWYDQAVQEERARQAAAANLAKDTDLDPQEEADLWTGRKDSHGASLPCPNCGIVCEREAGCLWVTCNSRVCAPNFGTSFCIMCGALCPHYPHPQITNCPVVEQGENWFLGVYGAADNPIIAAFFQSIEHNYRIPKLGFYEGVKNIFAHDLDVQAELRKIRDLERPIQDATRALDNFIATCTIKDPRDGFQQADVNYYENTLKTLATHLVEPTSSSANMDLLYNLSRKIFQVMPPIPLHPEERRERQAAGEAVPERNHERDAPAKKADRAIVAALCYDLMLKYFKTDLEQQRERIDWVVTQIVTRRYAVTPNNEQALNAGYKQAVIELQKKSTDLTRKFAVFKANVVQALLGSMRSAEGFEQEMVRQGNALVPVLRQKPIRLEVNRAWFKNGQSLLGNCDNIVRAFSRIDAKNSSIMVVYTNERGADTGGLRRDLATILPQAFFTGPGQLFEAYGDYVSPLRTPEIMQKIRVPEQDDFDVQEARAAKNSLGQAAQQMDVNNPRDQQEIMNLLQRRDHRLFQQAGAARRTFENDRLPQLRQRFFDAQKARYEQLYETFGQFLYLSIMNGLGIVMKLPTVFWAQLFNKLHPSPPAAVLDWLEMAINFYGQGVGVELLQMSPVHIFFNEDQDRARLIKSISNGDDEAFKDFDSDALFKPNDAFPLKRYVVFMRYLKAKMRCVETFDGAETVAMQAIRKGFFKHLGKEDKIGLMASDVSTLKDIMLLMNNLPKLRWGDPSRETLFQLDDYNIANPYPGIIRMALNWLTPEDFTFGIGITPVDPEAVVRSLVFEGENNPAFAQRRNLVQALKDTITEYVRTCNEAQRTGFLQEITGTPRYVDEPIKIIFIEAQDNPEAVFKISTCDRFIRVPVNYFNAKYINEFGQNMQLVKNHLKELLEGFTGGGAFNAA